MKKEGVIRMSLYTKIIDLQKLTEAWKKVKRNKPACGVDNVTCDEFDKNIREELKQLYVELEQHTYEVMPVKMVALRKENKMRMVSLYTMRDKVVQTSIANELNKMLEKQFSKCTYAYRNDLSAMIAIERIEKEIMSGNYSFVCKTDVTGFFDNINQDKLIALLRYRVKEEDVVELIINQLKAPSVGEGGELIEKSVGIYQGNAMSPIISNLYMDDFDKSMEKEDVFFVRYADDMVILAKAEQDLMSAVSKLKSMLAELDLTINTDKTYVRSISQGFQFLGYDFSDKGKSIPVKAEDKLKTGLEDVWLTMIGTPLTERLKKGSQILNGWEQYYRDERPISSIYEYVVIIYMMRYKSGLNEISAKRPSYVNKYKDIAMYLIEIWKENGWIALVRLEYEQLYDIANDTLDVLDETMENEIIRIYEEMLPLETEDLLISLMQAYSDSKLYNHAEAIMSRIQRLRDSKASYIDIVHDAESVVAKDDNSLIAYDMRTLGLIEELFAGREDMYTREVLTADKRRKSEFVAEPLTREVIKSHLDGNETVGTYLVRNNETVHYIVLDIDVSRKYLIGDGEDVDIQKHLQHAANVAQDYVNVIQSMGMKSYLEFSGYRGYHIWLFFSEWVPLRYAYSLLEIIINKIEKLPDDVTIEQFPVKNKKKSGSNGQYIKLPYGIHLVSGKRSFFLENDFSTVGDLNEYLSTITCYSVENVKRVIGANISGIEAINERSVKNKVDLDCDSLVNVPESVIVVLKGCNLMQYLVHKSMSTGYLSHFERLSILHVFGHLGDEGKEFVHTVMGYTLNYQYHITQRFIDKMPAKPVSCIKLREQYKQITAEYGCSCMFKRTKDCYPSPVIHALKNNTEDNHSITIPTSRTISASKRNDVYDELNVHAKVQDLAERIVELKKQKRGIDKSIKKIEKELCKIYDNNNADCMEVDMGLLVRRKVEDGYEWVIEI